MAAKQDFIDEVNNLLATNKTIFNVEDTPEWPPNRDGSGYETKLQVMVGGVMRGDILSIVYIPTTGAFHFSFIHLNISISRLDFDDSQPHTNPMFAYEYDLPPTVQGKHFHRWSLNTRFVNANGSLERLKMAEDLPVSIRNFDQAIRWFCDELKILLPHNHRIVLPENLL